MQTLIITVTFVIKPAHVADFRDAVLKNAATSLADEEGCLTFDVCENKEGGTIYLYERYVNDAAFDLHLAAPHFKSFDAQVSGWVESKKVERFYQLQG